MEKIGSSRAQAAERGGAPPETVDARILRLLWAAELAVPLLLLAASLLIALGIAALHMAQGGHHTVEAGVVVGCLLAAVLALFAMARQLRHQVLEPLARLEASVARVCQGEPGAALITTDTGVLGTMARDIDSLSREVHELYEDMDNRVARQTARLAQKTASLKILYDVAATINQADDLEALLLRFLRSLKEMVNGRTAMVRLQAPDGRMQLVGCIGLDDRVQLEEDVLPIRLCVCGKALTPADILCAGDPAICTGRNGQPMFGRDSVDALTVPLAYHDDVFGSYTIYVERPGIAGREDIRELLETIGQHLGIAVAKQRSDAEAQRLSIIDERNALAHELHDSLAQTLAGLRFQVRMLDDTLKQGGSPRSAMDDLARIRNGLDEAHTELRELLNSFRAPLDRRGLVPAIEQLTEQLARETGMHVFFQKDCRAPSLPAADEMQLLRIVQEALTNVRKHSKAQTVRVLLNCRPGGAYMLLVEDDGVGFDLPRRTGHPGEHIGLSIMEERARRLGGQVRIESEAGEGTRVEVTYNRREPLQGLRRPRVD